MVKEDMLRNKHTIRIFKKFSGLDHYIYNFENSSTAQNDNYQFMNKFVNSKVRFK